MISVRGLTKRYGDVLAVDDLTFDVEAGKVTGFLGPNGAGKTTTLRMVLGLIRPDAGTATFDGVPYADLPDPSRTVGAVLETAFHPARSGRNHLRVYCRAAGLPIQRADEVLRQVGLADAGGRRAGSYSLGMRQRLALAGALLGDPGVLVLDEPANGLDPEGIQWLRGFLRHLAHDQGRTVLVSSHLLSEVEQTVDRVVIVGAGRLVREGSMAELRAGAEGAGTVLLSSHILSEVEHTVDRLLVIGQGRIVADGPVAELLGDEGTAVRAVEPDALIRDLEAAGFHVQHGADGALVVPGTDPSQVGAVAAAGGHALVELRPVQRGLEDLFFQLTTAS